MRKHLLILLAFITVIICGCDKGNSIEDTIIGTWAMTGSYAKNSLFYDYSDHVQLVIKISSDGTFQQANPIDVPENITFNAGTLTAPSSLKYKTSKWRLDGNDLWVETNNDLLYAIPVGTIEIENRNKIITHKGAWGGANGSCVFEKVKKTVSK